MKTLVTFIMLCALWLNIMAQAPQKMSYQAVVHDDAGNPVTNQQVGIRITILDGNSSGSAFYQETQMVRCSINLYPKYFLPLTQKHERL